MSEVDFTLGGERINALSARFSTVLEHAERSKLEPIAADPDVSPEELLALMMRSAVSSLASAIEMIAREGNAPIDAVRAFAIGNVDILLASAVQRASASHEGATHG